MPKRAMQLISILLSVICIAAFSACGGTGADETTEPYQESLTKMPASTQEIVEYFNRVAGRVKTDRPQVGVSRNINIPSDQIKTDNEHFTQAAAILKGYMTPGGSADAKKGESCDAIVPVSGQTYVSRLSPDAVREAKCEEKEGRYEIEITLKEEENPAPLTSMHGQAFDIADKAEKLKELQKLSAGENAYLKVEDYNTRFHDCVIKCAVDRLTDEVASIEYQKRATVTSQAQGLGALQSLGQLSISFLWEENTNVNVTWVTPEDAQ